MERNQTHALQNMSLMSKNMTTIAVKLNRLDDISKDMSQINTKMSVLKPMLANMQEMNVSCINLTELCCQL
jgi:hypothetical protein